MGEGVTGANPFPRIEDKHLFDQVDGYSTLETGSPAFNSGFKAPQGDLPAGSAFLNLLASGCRSRLGRDWTNRSV